MKQHEVLKKFIFGLEKGLANSLIVCSPAGFGKTETTLLTMAEMGLKEGEHYLYVSNYITPVELYNLLQTVNKLKEPKILILDDIEETLKNFRVVGLLKGALWGFNGERKVCWVSGTHKIKRKEFNFTGRIIFLLNQLNTKNRLVQSLKDRGLFYGMELTNKEMIKLMEKRAELEYHGIPKEKRKEILNYLQKVGNHSKNLTLRLLPKAYNLFLLSPNHYQELIKELLT